MAIAARYDHFLRVPQPSSDGFSLPDKYNPKSPVEPFLESQPTLWSGFDKATLIRAGEYRVQRQKPTKISESATASEIASLYETQIVFASHSGTLPIETIVNVSTGSSAGDPRSWLAADDFVVRVTTTAHADQVATPREDGYWWLAIKPDRTDCKQLMMTVYAIDKTGDSRRAMDPLVDTVDDLLNGAQFDECKALFLEADPEQMSDPVIVSFMGITLGAKRKLQPERNVFYRRALSTVQKRRGGDGARRLLEKYL